MNSELKLNKFFFFKKINNKIALNQDDIVVAIGMIKNPISLKRATLISMFNKTLLKKYKKVFLYYVVRKKKLKKL